MLDNVIQTYVYIFNTILIESQFSFGINVKARRLHCLRNAKMHLFTFLGLFLASFLTVLSAKILAIFPYPGASQYIIVEPLLKALATRGHQLTVLNHHPQKQNVTTFREIKLNYPNYYHEVIKKTIKLAESGIETMEFVFEYYKNISFYTLENQEVKELMHSKKEHFDLVIVETLHTEVLYAFGEHFMAPLIGFSSFGTDPTIDSLVGNTSPVSYSPFYTSSLTDRMDFWQRLENFKLILTDWIRIQLYHMPEQEILYKKYFPHIKRDLRDICKNFSLLFVNQHFSLSFPRPYVPAMVEVGGLHISHKPSPLPSDMADFINGAKDGVIYFSMGSNIKSKDFPKEKIDILLKVFGRLKQRVMWKFEKTELPGKPSNVFISKWFPQPDILAHSNVKLFITHAGLLSTVEAIHHAKSIVGMPVFFDQFLNLERAKIAGFGLGVNFHTFTEADLMDAIEKVLYNPSYQQVASDISKRYHDQPMKPLDKAVYWTEYVLRYKGAPHMRVAGQDLSFVAYHSLDIISYLIGVWIVLPLLLVLMSFKVYNSGLGECARKTREANVLKSDQM